VKQFNFQLEPVLAYRRLIEDGEEEKLRGIQAAILKTQQTREDLGTQIELCGKNLEERSHGAIDMDEIRSVTRYLDKLREELVRTSQTLQKLEQDRKSQLATLLEARKDREVVEKLREDRLSDYRKETKAVEQKLLDELSVTQFGRINDEGNASGSTRKD
jgi:flagellar FliJ protein